MGQFWGIDYADRDDDFTDVTGTEYASGKTVDAIAGVLLEAEMRAKAASEALDLVRRQAVSALRGQGLSTRETASRLRLSKSMVARLTPRKPFRFSPEADIDRLVRDMWRDGLTREHERFGPRPGDKVRHYSIDLNIESSF